MKGSFKPWSAVFLLLFLAVTAYSQGQGSSRAERRDFPLRRQRAPVPADQAAQARVFSQPAAYVPGAVFSASMRTNPDRGRLVRIRGGAPAAEEGEGGSSSWLQWAR